MEVKVDIYVNRMVVSTDGRSKTVTGEFSSQRLLVGGFNIAVACLKTAVKELNATSFFTLRKPTFRIYPRERTEGGLSEIEERTLLEIGYSAGAGKVEIIVSGTAV